MEEIIRKAVMAPGIFFARKFDPLTDQEPINYLEQKISSSKVDTKSMSHYWQNSFNTLDDDPSMAVVGLLARAIVKTFLGSRDSETPELVEVREVTTLLVRGVHFGEVIQFVTGGKFFELLVKPSQEVKIVNRHSDLLKRTILEMKVGDQLDIKEKIFRNWLGAFDTSSALVLRIEFGSSANKNLFEILELTLHKNNEVKAGSLVYLLDWTQGLVFLPVSQMKRNLTAGVWTLQVSVKRQTIGMLTFLILEKDQR